ncbi:hypothetical protein ACQPXS_47245 (plasmid) [Streptomyces sp. CA-142005]|uniref:hypothetical protein n=1 Tax=Streptomyces sp. CA-142005 TaxID=3240052 RepID=UPI003D8AA7CC
MPNSTGVARHRNTSAPPASSPPATPTRSSPGPNASDPLLEPDTEAVPDTLRELYRRVLDDTRLGPRSLLRRMAADQGTDAASMIRRHSADAVRRAMSSGSWAALIRDVVQDWWREQASRTALTVRDDMRQEDFLPCPSISARCTRR